ncbi:F-box domain-containing protein [Macroventuria anomochaeta]|uniref:F-box domain-containing protein n=1 Tax=Macroventuria anomochaeta TaxID=301207 RepID=A0ACB6S976_9PLEO|nr:F-box domain-containing protein [Macroventuria anomochaeta]KAF2630072.1 F-box domain-containing protein [Macroventuria anomochaeta]
MASPHSTPGSPRTSSPLTFEEDIAQSLFSSPDDAHTTATHKESDDAWPSHLAVPNTAGASSAAEPVKHVPKGKEKATKGPLRLLDLPVDILKEIIHQLPHTNDLTSLSLCHTALHRLTIPCIYSRFDIVWPDESTHMEPRSGVDALTYGLATLVMGDECFPHQSQRYREHAAHTPSSQATTPYPIPRRRFGNYYGQFTKKFSLGNGPQAWVQEYVITKESGKMLGTLVALAIARMVNLETFVWDMPTGVLRDVWLALSSLAGRNDGDDCRLERLWIRWHDNTIDAPVPPPAPPMILNNANLPAPPNTTQPSGVGSVPPPVIVPQPFPASSVSALERVEHPTFSVIPALKSLSVLDIDELPYLDEMSILIARSQKKLRELRVGIAPHAQQRDWVTVWDGDGLQQVDYSATTTAASSIDEKRLGGVLGVLVGRIHNMRHSEESSRKASASGVQDRVVETTPLKSTISNPLPSIASLSMQDRDPEQDVDHFGNPMEDSTITEGISLFNETVPAGAEPVASPASQPATPARSRKSSDLTNVRSRAFTAESPDEPQEELLNGKLKLEVLELERIPLSVSVLRRAFDWSILSTLTLLHCSNHEQLWKVLRRTYTPRANYSGSPSSSKAYKASYTLRSDYQLNLKRIHTNTVSPSLISFLKETLAPNSLEVLFLQEGRSYSSTVTVDAIYRGPMRRHKASLKKLMIDSSEKGLDGHTTTSSRWRRWMMNREILTFITSGRMSSLRELAVSIDYKDWHHFLQRLPFIPHIRSLYIPFIADHAHGNNIDPRELAYQILDIVHLRPEIELCYMGLTHKCFEILENRPTNYDLRSDSMSGEGGTGVHGYVGHDPVTISDDESEATEDEDDDDDDGAMGHGGEETESEASDGGHEQDSDDESFLHEEHRGPKLRVREILFYEERVEAFRRRHGVLRP